MKSKFLLGAFIVLTGYTHGNERYMILDDLKHIMDPKTPPSVNTWSNHREYVHIANFNIYNTTGPLGTTWYGAHFRPSPPTDMLSKWQIRTMTTFSEQKSILYCEVIKLYRDKVFEEEGKIEDIAKIKCINNDTRVVIVFGKNTGIISMKVKDKKEQSWQP